MKERKLVLLYSGGLDSTILLNMAIKLEYLPVALCIDYGQRQRKEIDAARKNCTKLKVGFHLMRVDLGKHINTALTGDKIGGRFEGVSEWHVPGRNTIFVGLALSLAESIGATRIWYGANYEDRINRFPDCYQEWIYAMNKTLSMGASYPVKLEAPLLGMRKDTIQQMAYMFDVKSGDVHSGYDE